MRNEMLTTSDKRLSIALILSLSLACFFVFCAPGRAEAAVYYVDHGYTGGSSDGSEARPFVSIQQGVNAAYPGDTVLIKGSTDPSSPDAVYNVTGHGIATVRSGSAGKRITISSYPGHTVIIQGNGGSNGIDLSNSSYHTFKGLIIRNFDKATESWSTKYGIIIEDCEFTQTDVTGLRLRNVYDFIMRDSYVHNTYDGISVRDSDNVLFENVESSYNTDPNDGDGFHVWLSDNITYINCTAIGNAEDGFDISGNATLINALAANSGSANVKLFRRVEDGFAPKKLTIINSIFYGSGGDAGITVANGGEVHIYNSVFYGNGAEGIRIKGFSSTSETVYSEIINTIIFGNAYEGISVLQTAGGGFSNVSASNNLYFNDAIVGLTSDTNSINGQDPLFFSPETGDFHLQAGSPAIDTGTDLSAIFDYDHDNDIRPAGTGWDIGAYEWGSTSPDPDPDPEPEPEPESEAEPEPEPQADIPDVTSVKVSNNIIKKSENTSATIQCNLKEAGNLSVTIYDAKGREIITLCNEHKEAGSYTFTWAGKSSDENEVGSGIYIVHMKSGEYSETKKIAVIK